MLSRARRNASPITAWPGYVDVLSALLMVVIFVLMIFVVAQFLLSEVLRGQESELTRLHTQVSQLAEMLGLEKEKSGRLETQVARLSDTIIALSEDKAILMSQVADYQAQAEVDEETLKKQMLTIASLNEDISALQQVREQLEQEVGDLASVLASRDRELGVVRDRSMRLAARLADQTETTLLAQEKIEEQDIRIQALSAVLASQKESIERNSSCRHRPGLKWRCSRNRSPAQGPAGCVAHRKKCEDGKQLESRTAHRSISSPGKPTDPTVPGRGRRTKTTARDLRNDTR